MSYFFLTHGVVAHKTVKQKSETRVVVVVVIVALLWSKRIDIYTWFKFSTVSLGVLMCVVT